MTTCGKVMPQAKTMIGGIIAAMGLAIVIYSFGITDATALTINTAGILVVLVGAVIAISESMDKGHKLIAGIVLTVAGMSMVIYSLMPQAVQPFVVNTYGILIVVVGGMLTVRNTLAGGKNLIIGIGLSVVGMVMVLYSLGPAAPMALIINSVGILIVVLGSTFASREE